MSRMIELGRIAMEDVQQHGPGWLADKTAEIDRIAAGRTVWNTAPPGSRYFVFEVEAPDDDEPIVLPIRGVAT